MCWKTMVIVAILLGAVLLLTPSSSTDKEGFVTYVVYGPGWGYGAPGWGSFGGPGGWPYGYRPYWGWRRHYWNGPCPGPWCPYGY